NEARDWQEYYPGQRLGKLPVNGARPSDWPIGFDYCRSNATSGSRALRFTLHRIEGHTERFKMPLSSASDASGVTNIPYYDPSAYRPEDVQILAEQFSCLMAEVLREPERPISQLELLSESERRQLLGEWNSRQVAFPVEPRLHVLFENQVDRTPDAPAVRFREGRLSFRELNLRANQLAHFLCSTGVGPETRVGVYLERSVEMVVAVLGILKAGGAYVPLDPGQPATRLGHMLQQSEPAVLITQSSLSAALPVHDAPALCLD